MTATDQEVIDILASSFSHGRVCAQVPHQALWLGPDEDLSQAQLQSDILDRVLDRSITEGLLAWRVANPTNKLNKVLYTPEPRNPATGRLVSAYAWMTPLAIVRYGAELYQRYTQAQSEREKSLGCSLDTLPEQEFRKLLLQDTVPASPAFSSQVPADILAQTVPVKPAKTKSKVLATGFVDTLGPRQSSTIAWGDIKGQALLDQLDKWRVGPSTTLAKDPQSSDTIIQAVLSHAGPDGLAWLAARQFPMTPLLYRFSLSSRSPVALFDALEAAGVDPRATTAHGNLWNFIADTRRWDHPVVEWAKSRNISWNEKNDQGDVPLANLLAVISHEAGVVDFFNPDGPLGAVMAQMSAFALSMMGEADNSMEEYASQVEFFEGLALEMVRSGVDLTQKNKCGLSPADSIFPEQTSAQKRLFELTDPESDDRERDAMRALMFGDRSQIKRDPGAYGSRALEFIKKLEAASGQRLLDGESPPAVKPRGP